MLAVGRAAVSQVTLMIVCTSWSVCAMPILLLYRYHDTIRVGLAPDLMLQTAALTYSG